MKQINTFEAPHLAYRLLFPIWFVFWLIHAILHAAKYNEWSYVPQRLGISTRPKKNSIWIHAASVGEVNLIKPLCERLIKQGHHITLSTFTATGLQRARILFSAQVCIQAIPMDCWPISWFFATRLKAQCALIAETELWPETLFQTSLQKTTLIHINARLSSKSLQSPTIIKSLLTRTLSYFTAHLCRYESDIENFLAMGVIKSNIHVLGNLKYVQKSMRTSYQDLIHQPYILFASSHSNEEEIFTSLLNKSNIKLPLIVIVPRHPSRCKDIIRSITKNNIRQNQISIRSKNQSIDSTTKIYIADTFGEINPLAQYASIVIMGGSFVDIGGHNILEPAALGCCIITGPSDNNIRQDLSILKQHKAIIQVTSIDELAMQIRHLLAHPKERFELGHNAKQFVELSQHILDNYLLQIEEFLPIKLQKPL